MSMGVPAGNFNSRGCGCGVAGIGTADSDGWIGFVASVVRVAPDCAAIVDASDANRIIEKNFFTRLSLPCKTFVRRDGCNHGAGIALVSIPSVIFSCLAIPDYGLWFPGTGSLPSGIQRRRTQTLQSERKSPYEKVN